MADKKAYEVKPEPFHLRMLREEKLEKAKRAAELAMQGELDVSGKDETSESESESIGPPIIYASKKEEFEARKERMKLGKKPKKRAKT